ncbi:FkbM family methyltransferase [Pedobacter sp. HDW13]|uniref:FkbM family methyltransferase n=1 Tax=Pedobacter sp. HDW13 TaxID=2714940 RepID=UPI00140B919D|nr:FkbM family methyltransferase [Pedobacter sp. HDW13]QIL40665.1 FkbM family methyltransferase [Pedobacter sp. HDW13]
MKISSFLKNIKHTKKITSGLINGIKWLLLIYRIPKKLNPKRESKFKVKFKYPYPIGSIDLIIRDNGGADTFIISEVFEHNCYFLSSTQPIRTILDLGANAGFTTVYLSKLFPQAQIACIEPINTNIDVLKQNIGLNDIKAKVIEAAVSINDGYLQMALSNKDYGHKVEDIEFGKQLLNSKVYEVKGVSIPTVLADYQWEQIDLLKIDIEGYEGVLLTQNNEWLSKTNTIIIEIHEGVDLQNLKQIMISFSFKYFLERGGNFIFSKFEIK